ncbi:MAG: hypothetical protein J5979_03055 [Lachnospiraceae bacterium]|nr:hypothetical protein [Lachnospiraceae bacterium]
MSNLIKSVYFNFNQDGKRIIDSDSQVEQFIPEIFHQDKIYAAELSVDDQQEENAGEFQAGMNFLNMEDVRREERDKVEKETSEQVEQMLLDARKEADSILCQAKEEAEEIRLQAYEEGKSQGMSEGQELARQELETMQAEFQQKAEQQRKELDEQAMALEPKFADIMIALIEKITGVLCQDNREIVIYLIHQALYQLEKTSRVTLRVSKDDMLLVSARKQELKENIAQDVEFDIMEDESLEAMQCIIETDNKIIDCSLDVQLDNLRSQIKMLTIL